MKRRSRIIHLNCFDKLLLAFEVNCTGQRIGYSGIFSVRGEPDPDKLRKAIMSTARAHPELMTTVRGGPFRHYRQVHDDVVGEALEVQDLAALQAQRDPAQADTGILYEQRIHEWINQPLDTGRVFPFRVLLLKKGTADYALIFTFHHSAIDAVRAVRLVDDVISRYHDRAPDASLLPQGARLDRKGDELLELARSERAKTKRFYREMLAHLSYFVFINPLFHPARIFHDKSERSGEVRFCSAKIGPAEFQQLKAKSKSVGSTLNDILMAVCYRSIDKWNKRHGKRTRKISLLVPIDIGSPALNGIISNQISFISFSTSAKDRTDSTRLLRKVSARRIYMLKQGRGNTYSIVYFAWAFSHLPLAAMKVFSKYVLFPLYADTVVCTNPGIVRVGDCGEGAVEPNGFRLVDFEAVPHVYSGMGMNICVATFNGNLGIHITYATSHFSREKAEEFLALCLDEVANYEVNPQQD